jgi:hypothetical protein
VSGGLERGGAWARRALAGLLCGGALLGWDPARAEPPEAPAPVSHAPGGRPADDPGWLDDRRLAVERGLSDLSDYFDQFFGNDPRPSLESPSSRLHFKTYVRTAQDRDFAVGGTASASVHLPRLERWLDNARLVLVGDTDQAGLPAAAGSQGVLETAPVPPTMTDASASYLWRGRGHAELRFDLFHGHRLLLDTGVGTTLAWPPVPFARLRAHLRFALGAGLLLRATGVVFAEPYGRGPGISHGLEVGRFLAPSLWLRWVGQGLFARRTRGVEWSTLVGAEWMVGPRTGLYSGVGASGFGTPQPGLDTWRVWTGVRQDLWRGWVFAGLQPELIWPRSAGQARRQVWAVTARFEVVLDSRPQGVAEPP